MKENNPFAIIRKRDGRLVRFEKLKIRNAILKALSATGQGDAKLADALTEKVIDSLKLDFKGTVPQVEDIQDEVERVLISEGLADTAKAYILYRAMRSHIREGKSALMDTVEDILKEQPEPEPYQINSPSAKMLKIAQAASRSFYLARLIPNQYSEAHKKGEIYIHDLDYYGKTIDSFHIPLKDLLQNGFYAGYGYIRPPKRLSSATAIAAIILQSCQNDLFGCQSFASFDRDLAEFGSKFCDEDEETVFQAMEGIVYNLNSMYSRVGAHVPLSSISLGTDTSKWGRMITRSLLRALQRGLGKGETPLFPQVVFKLKRGVNLEPQDPNYDLFKLALEVAARRMNPTFAFLDAPYNTHLKKNFAYFASGVRIADNCRGNAASTRRGNIATVTINLPRVALKVTHKRKNFPLESFFKELEKTFDLAKKVLMHRLEVLSHLKLNDLSFVMGERLYEGTADLNKDDEIGEALVQGNLSIGFTGLAEALILLCGKAQNTSEGQTLGLEIVEFMLGLTHKLRKEHNLNFVLTIPAAEELCGYFAKTDKQMFGKAPLYYTKGFQLPYNLKISWDEKLATEAPYHRFCNGGHFTFLEGKGFPENLELLPKIILTMQKLQIGYGGISFPLNECKQCGNIVKAETCEACGSNEIRKIRRFSTFLAPLEFFSPLQKKVMEERLANF
jgi:anaerobic ribonucleoside-triphosphate reductase